MQAGRLDRRVTIEQATATQNDYGEPVRTWSTLATVWAEKLDLKASERFAGDQHDARIDTVWRIRYRADVTPLMRVSHGGLRYDIQGTRELGRRAGLELLTTAQVPRRGD
jgi:SPP1 family predicted phage head-tail adaptor